MAGNLPPQKAADDEIIWNNEDISQFMRIK
jgi:hypothetical protein